MTGRLFMVIGPSGAGKDTLLAGCCDAGGPHWVRRVITRPSVLGGEPYEGVSAETFAARAAQGAFALVWQAHGLSYGIPWAELAPRQSGRDVVFNGSRAALTEAARLFADLTVIHITAAPEVLAARLSTRGREGAADIAARLARVVEDWPQTVPVIDLRNDGTVAEGIARLKAVFQRTDQPVKGAR